MWPKTQMQVVGEARTGEICGEIGVLCHMPHVFTVRTKQSTQLLRLNYTTILKIHGTNWAERDRIMNTLRKVHTLKINNKLEASGFFTF